MPVIRRGVYGWVLKTVTGFSRPWKIYPVLFLVLSSHAIDPAT